MSHFSITVRVYIEDTDAGGIVYYVNYLKYLERARTELLRSVGFDKPAILDEGCLLVVHSAEIKYQKPALLDNELTVTARVSKLARSYVIFEQSVMRGEEPICQASIKVACVDQQSMKPCALPERVASVVRRELLPA
ncbi:tol-pal system-associated acyl-CoA thioesterase [Pseudomaricurvus sp. HS19]|uniref:tol-pal system-associated acyl-CoA thioesterase n=1 Tax=Pseudomaricurvus sp. HS19 TaxID=2692626 RepID=UPI001925689C|nr:tol-pal system-associated acyl-CoA thioesterase [Pseudomaricurvus sp. HS19]